MRGLRPVTPPLVGRIRIQLRTGSYIGRGAVLIIGVRSRQERYALSKAPAGILSSAEREGVADGAQRGDYLVAVPGAGVSSWRMTSASATCSRGPGQSGQPGAERQVAASGEGERHRIPRVLAMLGKPSGNVLATAGGGGE